MQKIIFTSQPASAELCLNELNGAGLSFNFLKWLGAGVGILETDISFSDFSVAVRESRLIFLRHICPADIVISLENAGAANLNQAVLAVCDNIKDTLPKDSGFSVQVRRSADVKCDISGLQHTIADEISSCGCSLNVRCPVNILSVYICRDEAYIGMSAAADNLSSWPGGMRRYAMLPQTVSRAEFKLLEALEYLNISIKGGRALDLGAAPGGWSRVLAEKGCLVDAVDPADLAEAVSKNPNITHHKCLAQDFAQDNNRSYDIIVNDMKMDVQQSAGIIMDFAGFLKPDGIVIMTFKLVKKNRMAAIRKGIELLQGKYECLMLKQLFNNRSEVTVALKRK